MQQRINLLRGYLNLCKLTLNRFPDSVVVVMRDNVIVIPAIKDVEDFSQIDFLVEPRISLFVSLILTIHTG